MFNLLRHYAIRSFVGVLVAAALLAATYRYLEIQETIELARKGNLVLAEAALDAVGPELGEYLRSVRGLDQRDIDQFPFPSPLAAAIARLKETASIAKLRIYNDQGVVVYSTEQRELGSVDSGDSGFIAAIKGQAISDIAYRDAFGGVGPARDEDNQARTFVPARFAPAQSVQGVLATYVDLGPVMAQNQQEVLVVGSGIALILALLYCALLFVVMRAKKLIEAQQQTIRDRAAKLESLSVQLLVGAEAEKSNLAANLHEGLAQKLTAIKTRIEDRLEQVPAARDESLNTALIGLQGAIEEVQEMATELRPSSLDELGLLPTIRWYCREFECLHPDIRIEQQISAQEQDIPQKLRIVIYRIIEAVLKDIGENAHKDRIRLSLQPNANSIILSVDDIPQGADAAATMPGSETPHPGLRFAAAQERAMLSGGAFSAAFNREGGITLHASWST